MNSRLKQGPGIKSLEEPFKSIQEFENWKHSVLYSLRLDGDYKEWLKPNAQFGKKTAHKPHRDLKDVGTGTERVTAETRCNDVDFMLEQIAQYCPKIPHNDIVKDCGSLDDVWQVVRQHSNIETSGALLNDCWNLTRNPNETPQALYSRIKQHYDDNLIRKNTLHYKGAALTADEEMSPTLHCTIILHWLNVLHPKLRDRVTQRFSRELRTVTYADIWPEISHSVDSLLSELAEDSSICRFGDSTSRYSDTPRFSGYSRPPSRSRGSYSRPRGSFHRPQQSSRQQLVCDYCRIMNRRSFNTHTINDCIFLKREKNAYDSGASNAFDAEECHDEMYSEYYEEYPVNENCAIVTEHYINRVAIHASPVLTLYHNKKPYNLTLDTGGTCNVLDHQSASSLNCDIRPTYQRARMADGRSSLSVLGETDIEFTRSGKSYRLTALVCDIPEPTILAGMPFMRDNDVGVRPAKAEIIIDGSETVKYYPQKSGSGKSRRVDSYTVRSQSTKVVLPGESVSFKLPAYMRSEKSVAVEPRFDNGYSKHQKSVWPAPKIHKVDDGALSFTNTTSDPVILKKHEHVCNIQPVVSDDEVSLAAGSISQPSITEKPPSSSASAKVVPNSVPSQQEEVVVSQLITTKKSTDYSASVNVNPDKVLSKEEEDKVSSLLHKYDEVFNPEHTMYNGKSGPCFVEVNMGKTLPPQNKGRVPFYGKDTLVELQEKIDALERKGVLRRPREIGVTVENLNPSFLVKKQTSNDKRMVTDFSSIADYCRPTPTLMPDCDKTLRMIASWKYIIPTDLTEAYFQLALRKASMKYCGIASPFKGIFVYTAGAMGLPGTEVALEELTCLLFGDMVKQGKVAKLADDLLIGGNTVAELLQNFEEVLCILLENNIRLSAKKTTIAPLEVTILGWLWRSGCLKASAHKLSALSECEPPSTIKALRSFLGAYRYLSRVIKNHATLLLPLEAMVIGQPTGRAAGNIKIQWSEAQLEALKSAQSALRSPETIVIPCHDDMLQIVTDAAVQPTAIGAALYVIRGDQTLLAGFFNAKLPRYKRRWLPCELEAVAISAALIHFAPYIRQSVHRPCVLTDNKPCVDAVAMMNRGQYSASARLCTFLSTVSRYQAVVKHIQGTANMTSDYISRNPVTCSDHSCQVCKFLQMSMESVVLSAVSCPEAQISTVSVSDVLDGKVHLPFTNKRAWVEIQEECPDLRNVFKYLSNGTKPGKKGGNLRKVKRYISAKTTISAEGALVVSRVEPFNPVTELIVVPQGVLHGLLTVLHLKLEHPSTSQLVKVFKRFFFALNLEKAAAHTWKSCHQCSSLQEIPAALKKESTESPPDHLAQTFAADVIKRNGQLILVLRECTSSYTQATIIPSETAADISAGLQRLCNIMRPSTLTPISIRVDPHKSHQSLFQKAATDEGLSKFNIRLVIGDELNINHNPVAEKCIREVLKEMLAVVPDGGRISDTILSYVIAVLNSRLRAPGVSAHEVFTQRDQTTGQQLTLDDMKLIRDQHERRISSHKYSEKSKSGGKPPHPDANVRVGSIVYRYDDGSKLNARPRYVVLSVKDGFCFLRRFADKRLGNKSYRLRISECYTVPDEIGELPELPADEDDTNVIVMPNTHKPTMVTQEDPNIPDDPIINDDAGSDDEEYKCSVCDREVGDEDDALQCDSCKDWCHRECGNIPIEDYELLLIDQQDSDDEEVEWVCPVCPAPVEPAVVPVPPDECRYPLRSRT